MLKYNNLPARVIHTYNTVDKNEKPIILHDLVLDAPKPLILARGVRLNATATRVID